MQRSRRIIKEFNRDSIRDFNCDLNIAVHIDNNDLSRLLIARDVPGLIKRIYRDPNAPWNHCVRYSQGIFAVHNQGKWDTDKSTPAVTRELIETAYRVFRKHFDNNSDFVYEMFVKMEIEPDMFGIEVWLEDLWDGDLKNLGEIKVGIQNALKLSF